jgi:hypothetical protein
MSDSSSSELGERIRSAFDSNDLSSVEVLLHPDVRWGPPGGSPAECTNRRQVVSWWARSRDAGASAEVAEVVVGDGKILVGFRVRGTEGAELQGGVADRWQVLTLRDGLIGDIRGYDDRERAALAAGVAP